MATTGQKKLKILVLDGGGIKGLSSLLILQRIMAKLGHQMKKHDLEPHEYFDMIGGTSTGGIIALMLGRMRMPVEKCIAEYQELGKVVFGKSMGPPHEYMFDASILETQTKKVIEKYLVDENAPLLDPLGDDACKTVVFTLPYKSATPEKPEALRTYINHNADPRPKVWTIWEAVRATSAATTIFEPLTHGREGSQIRYIDAAFGFNNPASVVLDEAASLWTDTGYLDTRMDVGCFLSIGTGLGDITRMDSDSVIKALAAKVQKPLQAVNVMKRIVTGTEPVHSAVARRFDPSSEVYQRFNVDQGIQGVKLFEYEKREEIEVDTTTYINKSSVEKQMRKAVNVMKVLGVRTPQLMDNRSEEVEVFSIGSHGLTEEEKLRKRLEALKIAREDFESHKKHWESRSSLRETGSQYYQILLQESGSVDYIWNGFIQADLLDKRGRCILAGRLPSPSESRLLHLSGDEARVAYRGSLQDVESTAQRLMLAHGQFRDAFRIYRQMLYTAQASFGETSLMYCWAAKRLASLLELWGCQRDALHLYMAARVGKSRRFERDHWSVRWLERKIEQLHVGLSES